MADLFSIAAVGAAIGEVSNWTLETLNRGRELGPTLERIIETLNSLAPLVEEMKRYNQLLDRPVEEIETLVRHLKDAEKLVLKHSKFSRWRIFPFPCYRQNLEAVDESLKRHLALEARDLRETLSEVRETLVELSKEDFGHYDGIQLGSFSGAPSDEPDCVQMDEHLNKLKIELLKDGVSVLVLTGLGGSGKSTLAKKLCWDPQIKDKFGRNIFFVTVSKTPDLKTIAQKLFECCGRETPEFQNDEDTIKGLGVLLRNVGRNPILLVLDDVLPNSETLVEKFVFQMKDYKILVTSRVALRRSNTSILLEPLDHDQAVSFFHHYTKIDDSQSDMPEENLVHEIVRGCKGSPLALKVIAGSLFMKPFEFWENMRDSLRRQSILESSKTNLLHLLQQSLDTLEDKFSINEKEFFKDLGLFPEEQRIPVSTLIDLWAELHNLDEDGSNAMTIVHDLTTRNLINLIVTRKVAKDGDTYYNNHFVILHDLLKELAIQQSKGKEGEEEAFEQRERLIIELNGDNKRPEWWVGPQGRIAYMLSSITRMFVKHKQLRVAARVLSISTDETFTSEWCDMQPDEAEVLVLNIRSSNYSLPDFTGKMSKLKVLIVTNYGFHRTELNKFELLSLLPNLKKIILEKVSVPSLCALKNLRKLSLHKCNIRQAFESSSFPISDSMPSLVEMRIDKCSDLVKLPDWICKITPLKMISIINCVKLSALPQEIGKLKNLEVLRLCSCSDLVEMPDSIVGLKSYAFLTCQTVKVLPNYQKILVTCENLRSSTLMVAQG